jgi:hypothetical protein
MGFIIRQMGEPFFPPIDAISFLHLPSPISLVVRSLHGVHFFSRAVRRLEIRQQHPGLYLAGVFFNARYGDTEFLKVTAQVVRIARIFLSLVEQSGQIARDWERLKAAFRVPQLIAVPYGVNRMNARRWKHQEGKAPPHLFLSWPAAIVLSPCTLVSMRVGKLVQDIWELNMHLFDLYDAIQMDPHTRAAAIEELFIDVGQMADDVVGPERRLSKAVREHQRWVDEVLKMLHVKGSAQELADVLDLFADRSRTIGTRAVIPLRVTTELFGGVGAIAGSFFGRNQ